MIDLEAIEKRCKAATEGEWTWFSNTPHNPKDNEWSVDSYACNEDDENLCIASDIRIAPDADFIAHSRQDIPALISEIKMFREYLRRAVNSSCSCGGAGPGEGCPACEVWHKMNKTEGDKQ